MANLPHTEVSNFYYYVGTEEVRIRLFKGGLTGGGIVGQRCSCYSKSKQHILQVELHRRKADENSVVVSLGLVQPTHVHPHDESGEGLGHRVT